MERKVLIENLVACCSTSPKSLSILERVRKKKSYKDVSKEVGVAGTYCSQILNKLKTNGLVEGTGGYFRQVPMVRTWNIDSELRKATGTTIKTNENKPYVKKLSVNKPRIQNIPYIDPKIESEAEKMTRPYTVLYLLENSLRYFINSKLSEKYGKDWWDDINIKSETVRDVKDRMNLEKTNKWHARRGSHEIFYTDLEDLPYFLNKEKIFFDQFIDVDLWTTYIRKIVKLSRNIVDHHNPLPEREIKRLEGMLEDWKRQLS
ncbi:MAG: hypothetical protein ACREAK_07595 [Nitrosarchaeum sp.]